MVDGGQGRAANGKMVRRICSLLERTDMTIADIAARMGCSRSCVASINRRFQVRDYRGNRSRWTVRKTREPKDVELTRS